MRFHSTSCKQRGRSRLLTILLGAVVVLALAPAVAGALVVSAKTGAGPETVVVGEQPTNASFPLDGNAINEGKAGEEGPNAPSFNNPEGNAVMHSVGTYLVYWDPGGGFYHGEWQELIDRYMADLSGESDIGGDNVFSVDAQYTDRTGNASAKTRFLGAGVDTNPYPSANGCKDPYAGLAFGTGEVCLSDAQVRQQLRTFISEQGLKAGMGTIFYLLTPPAVDVCVGEGPSHCSQEIGKVGEGLCSYHSYYTDLEQGTVLYAAIPWVYGDLGGISGYGGSACQDGGWNENAEKGGPLKQQSPKLVPQEPNQLLTVGADGMWDKGIADLVIGQMASEQQNTITDPLLNAWQDREKVEGETVGYENTDECRNFFLPAAGGASKKEHTEAGTLFDNTLLGDKYYINTAFDLAAWKLPYPAVPCLPGISLVPQFTVAPTVNSGEIVGFNGMESDISLNAGETFTPTGEEKLTYPTYTWNFGDGTSTVSGYAPGTSVNPPALLCPAPWLSPCASSTFHAYQYGGLYKVTLTVKDVVGNVGTVTHEITVVGPPPPSPPSSSTPGGSGGSGGPAGSGGSSSGVPAPEALVQVASSSLRQIARGGLLVHYSVNEQVTGHFEVLLGASAAHRLKISAPAASGLPAGFPKSLVIGHALLVTLKGGHSSVRIKFPKSIAKRLRAAHKVTLTLRLTVRNASPQSPLFTTTISTAVLHH